MPVKFYSFGRLVGGVNPDGTTTAPPEAEYGPVQSFVGTLVVGITTFTFTATTKSVSVRNTHDLQPLSLSLDAGLTWELLAPYQVLEKAASVTSIQLRDLVGNTTYEVIGILTE